MLRKPQEVTHKKPTKCRYLLYPKANFNEITAIKF